MSDRAYLERTMRELTDKGRLVEAGWVGFRLAAIPSHAPKAQLEEMRSVFFAGAQHLFSSIMTVLDPGQDPTEPDLARMEQIASELERFIRTYETSIKTEGSA